jgi:hypothetical protein
LTGSKWAYRLGAVGLVLTVENLLSKHGALGSNNQERLYTAYSVLGLVKYLGETVSGIPKAQIASYTAALKKLPGYQDFLKSQPGYNNAYLKAFHKALLNGKSMADAEAAGQAAAIEDAIDNQFKSSAVTLSGLTSQAWYKALGGVYYTVGAVSAGWEAYDLAQEPNADPVPIALNSLEALGNAGNALKPVIGELFGAEALGETVAAFSSIIGLAAALGLTGWQLYEAGKQTAAYNQDAANFLKDSGIGTNPGAGLAPGLITLLTRESPEQLSTALQAYAKQYKLQPQQLLLALNNDYEDPYTRPKVETFLFEASRLQQSNGAYPPSAPDDRPLTPQQAQHILYSPDSLLALYYWSQALFGANGLGETPPKNH